MAPLATAGFALRAAASCLFLTRIGLQNGVMHPAANKRTAKSEHSSHTKEENLLINISICRTWELTPLSTCFLLLVPPPRPPTTPSTRLRCTCCCPAVPVRDASVASWTCLMLVREPFVKPGLLHIVLLCVPWSAAAAAGAIIALSDK